MTNHNIIDLQNICECCLKCMPQLIAILHHYPFLVEHQFMMVIFPSTKQSRTNVKQALSNNCYKLGWNQWTKGTTVECYLCMLHVNFTTSSMWLKWSLQLTGTMPKSPTMQHNYHCMMQWEDILLYIWMLFGFSFQDLQIQFLREQFGWNVLHIALNVKKVTEWLINLLLDTVHKELLQQMADNGMTPLHFACLHQNDAIILSVLTKNAHAANMVDNERNLPFHFSCGWYPVLESNTLHTLLNSFCRKWCQKNKQ